MCSLERAYQAAVVENSNDEGAIHPHEVIPRKKKQLSSRAVRRLGCPMIMPQAMRPLLAFLPLSHRKARPASLLG